MPLASGHPDGHNLTTIKAQTLSSITLKDTTTGAWSPHPSLPYTHLLISLQIQHKRHTQKKLSFSRFKRKATSKSWYESDSRLRCGPQISTVCYCFRHECRGTGSESCAQWGLSLLGAMLLAIPLTLLWPRGYPGRCLLNSVGQRGALNSNRLHKTAGEDNLEASVCMCRFGC